MKISRDLFELLSTKSSEVIKKLEAFLQTQHIVEVKKYNYEDGVTKRYILSRSPGKFHKDLENHISAYCVENGKISSISFTVGGDINIGREIERTNIWGKKTSSIQTRLEYLQLSSYPLVSNLNDIPFFKEGETWIDFEEFTQEIRKTTFVSNVDIKILESFNQFVLDLILEYQTILRETNNELTTEIKLIDKNGDGQADILDAEDFMKLINKHQLKIIEVEKNYLLKFIRISNYLKKRKQNIQTIFNSLMVSDSLLNKTEMLGILKNQIHSYELLVFHSLNMIGAIVKGDLVTFYEIYETFDKLSVFNSNWENEIAEKLTTIGDKLDDLMHSIYNMEQNILSELSHLSYVTQESFSDLSDSVTGQLSDIGSSIKMNNLLAGIQAYQLYRINKNTKALRS